MIQILLIVGRQRSGRRANETGTMADSDVIHPRAESRPSSCQGNFVLRIRFTTLRERSGPYTAGLRTFLSDLIGIRIPMYRSRQILGPPHLIVDISAAEIRN
jgi:hypothetical protein